MPSRSHHPERQRNPEIPTDLDVTHESRRRIDDIQYESMRKRFLPRAREQMAQRLSSETPITPWQRGRNYEWIRMQNGMAYAVFYDGTVKVSLSQGNRLPFKVGLSMCPSIVQQKHMELTVARKVDGTSRESAERGLRWSTRTQRGTNEQYEYVSLPDGTKYAIFHRGPRIQRFTRREGIANIPFNAAPAFIQERAMEFRVQHQSQVPRAPASPSPEERRRPPSNALETGAPPEVVSPEPTRSEVQRTDLEQTITPVKALEMLRAIQFHEKNGNRLDIINPEWFSLSLFQKFGIPDARIGEFVENMQKAAERLQNYLSSIPQPIQSGSVIIGNQGFVFRDASRGILSTHCYLLTEKGQKIVTQYGEEGRLGSLVGQFNTLEFADRTEFFSMTGSLRMKKFSDHTEFYDGDNGSRPTIVMANSPTDIVLDGKSYSLGQGMYYIPERGAPIGRFEQKIEFQNAREKAEFQMTQQDRERTQKYIDDVVRTLKTPEAINAFVTSNFDFVSRGGLHGGLIHGEAEEHGEQYAQHPLRTVFLGSGDCEDFAILLQYMCARAKQLNPETGASSFVAKTYETHNAAYYLEQYTLPNGSKAYALCKMHVHGFERKTSGRDGKPFLKPEDALRAIWDSFRSISGVHAEIVQIESDIRNGKISAESVSSYLSTLKQLRDEGGGLILMNKDLQDVNDAGVQEGPARFTADFSAFVKRG